MHLLHAFDAALLFLITTDRVVALNFEINNFIFYFYIRKMLLITTAAKHIVDLITRIDVCITNV